MAKFLVCYSAHVGMHNYVGDSVMQAECELPTSLEVELWRSTIKANGPGNGPYHGVTFTCVTMLADDAEPEAKR